MRVKIVLMFAAAIAALSPAIAQAPAAPPKHPLTVDAMLSARIVADPQLSPEGEWLLYALSVTDFTANARRWSTFIVSATGGAPRPFPGDTTRATEARWSPDGKRIAYTAGGQLWVADVNGGNRLRLTTLAGGASGPVWSPTGDRIAFTSSVTPSCRTDACDADSARARANAPTKAHIANALMYRSWNAWDDGTRRHLFVIPATGGAPLDLTEGAGYDVPPGPFPSSEGYAFSPDGAELAYTAKDQARAAAWSDDENIYLVPVSGGAATVITAANPAADADPVYSPDGRFIAYRARTRAGHAADRERLMLYDRSQRTSRELLPSWDRSAGRYLFAGDSRSIILESVEAARTKIFRVALADAAAGAVRAEGAPVAIISERNNTAVTLDRAGRSIAWVRDAIDRPPEAVVAALSAGGISSLRVVTHANDSLLAAVRLFPAEEFWFKSVLGDSVQGLVVRPPQWAPGASYPTVLLIHGGPQSAWLDSWGTRWSAQLFASPGYGVVMVNPRGSVGYGQKFTDQVSRDWGGAAHTDLMNGLDAALARFGWLDSARVAAAGGSFGGYMANWIEGHDDRFRTLISHAGVYDLEAFAGATDEQFFVEWELGVYWDPLAMATQYRTWSPHLFAKRFHTPMLVIAGERDYRVPYTESLALFEALQRQGVTSRLVIFPDEGHWILKPQNQRLWWSEVLGWLQQGLAVAPAGTGIAPP